MKRLTVLAAALALCAAAPSARAADLGEIKARGVLRHLGVPYANFVSGAGDGMDVELTQAFARSLGLRYEYVPTDWATVVPDLVGKKVKVAGGKVEVLADAPVKGDLVANGFTVLPWRKEVVAFSTPTFPSQIWLVARADSPLKPITPSPDPDIQKDIAQARALMKNHTVLTLEKTCLDPGLYNLSAAGAKVVAFKGKLNEVAPALLNNEAELTILDVPDALIALEKWHSKIKVLGPISAEQQMGAGFSKDAPKLLEAYNGFIARAQQDGSYLKLVKKYYPAAAAYFPGFFKGMR